MIDFILIKITSVKKEDNYSFLQITLLNNCGWTTTIIIKSSCSLDFNVTERQYWSFFKTLLFSQTERGCCLRNWSKCYGNEYFNFSLTHDEYLPLLLHDVWVSYFLDVWVVCIWRSEILREEKYRTGETMSRELPLLFLGFI